MRSMEERDTSGDLLTKHLSISTWETSFTAPNGSNNDTSLCDIQCHVLISLSFIISLVGMVLNAIVIWFLGSQMHRNAFSVYILNLAVADFLFLCSQFLFCLLAIIYTLNCIPIHTVYILDSMSIFPYLSGLSILSVISIERCLSVMWPIWYRCQRWSHTSAATCVLLWALSLLFAFLEGKACDLLFNSSNSFWCQTFDFITAVWSIALFVVLCGFSLTLLVRIFCGSHRIPVTRLYVTIALTVLFFLIFGLPFGISWVLQWNEDLCPDRYCDFLNKIQLLSCINSCGNPIIYFLVGSLRHHRFQWETLKVILQRAMQDTPEEEGGGTFRTS